MEKIDGRRRKMIFQELSNQFGKGSQEQAEWISKNVEKLGEEEKKNFLSKLLEMDLMDFPTIGDMKKVYQDVTGKKPPVYYWSKCLECGAEYDYQLPLCPVCYDNGLECRAYAVKTSENQPPFKVIRYNKKYLQGINDNQNCYSCPNRKMSFCPHFGQVGYECKEFRECKCFPCCSKARKGEEELLEQQKQERKPVYAKPFKKIN